MLLPSPLPGSLALGSSQGTLFVPSSYKYDYAIGGLPFLSAASRENPLVRETAPIRKQQFDSANTPGENSLAGWWLRSQQSFHGGAGQIFGDPTGYAGLNIDPTSLTRFKSSRNVNVWTQGRVFLLNAAKKASGSPIANVVDVTEVVYPDGSNTAIMVGGSSIYVVQASGVNTYAAAFTANALQSITTDGSNVYISAIDGVWSAPIPATPATAFTWTKQYTVSGVTTKTHLAFVKSRLMAGLGPSVYELPPRPATPPVALPAAKYTHPDPAWVWTSITDSPGAIYVVGNNGVRGSILKFVLDNVGAIPTLSGGAIAAQLPSGEVPYSAMGYLGAYVGIGTTRGVRVAVSDDQGNLQYGPILFPATDAPKCWSARDRFLFVSVTGQIDGDSGVYRIDLSNQVADMRFSYATDLNFAGDSTAAKVVAHLGSSDTICFATATDVYVEDTTKLATTGYIQSSRMRFSTLEPKLYKQIKAQGPSLQGALSFTILDQHDALAGSYTWPTALSPGDVGDVDVSQPQDPQDFISVKFTLQRDPVTNGVGAEFWGYQLKALPGLKRQRMIQIPLLCFDWEHDPNGQRRGYRGAALARLTALENLERNGNSIVFQDLGADNVLTCVIEQVSFRQSQPPLNAQGFGGIVMLTLRTV